VLRTLNPPEEGDGGARVGDGRTRSSDGAIFSVECMMLPMYIVLRGRGGKARREVGLALTS
jgi:hypothetical protein